MVMKHAVLFCVCVREFLMAKAMIGQFNRNVIIVLNSRMVTDRCNES